MADLRPTPAFRDVLLDRTEISAGAKFGRIFHARFPDPLGFGKSRSRFSDPRDRVDRNRFGVLYLGATLKVCFVEAILRDLRNGVVGDYPIEEAELVQRRYAEITIVEPLILVDLRGDGPIRMGVPSDVTGASAQSLARRWSVAFYEHPAAPDGVLYPSRLNEESNLVIYDRAVSKLRVARDVPLIAAPGFAQVLDMFKVALI